jgi:maleate isomerase
MQRLGIIVPSSNTTVETEFSTILQGSNITLHTARMSLNNVTIKELTAMTKQAITAARQLKDAKVDAMAYACTSGSLLHGLGQDRALAEALSQAAKCPAIVTATAIIDALEQLHTQRIALATPYTAEINKREVDFLEAYGFEVVKTVSLNIKENLKIGQRTPADAAALAKTADDSRADTIIISCTNFRTFETIPQLEEQLQKPVISSNTATLWATLKILKPNFHTCLGKLFST